MLENVFDFVGYDSSKGMVITFTNFMAQTYNQLIINKRAKPNGYQKKTLNAKFYVRTKTNFIANLQDNHSDSIRRQRAITDIQLASQSEIKI